MKNWQKVAIGGVVGSALIAHPVTRQVVFFVLPLGSGWDDVLGGLGICVAVFLLARHARRHWKLSSICEWLDS